METKKLKKSVKIRLEKEKKAEFVKNNMNAQGEALAILNDVPTSPRKMRIVADQIRGQKVSKALTILKYDVKVPSIYLEKLLLSAVSNWQQKNQDINLEDADLYIKTVFVDGGRMLKRLRTAPQGRGYRVRKRSNHITMVIDSAKKQVESVEA